jgi:hypothetical protein
MRRQTNAILAGLSVALFLLMSAYFPLMPEKFLNYPVSFWYKEGFSLPESAEIVKESGKDKEAFLRWLKKQNEKRQKKITAILLSNKINLYPAWRAGNEPSASNENYTRSKISSKQNSFIAQDKKYQSNTKDTTGSFGNLMNSDFFFLGGSYQNLDTRYLPLELRNHSSVMLGGSTRDGKWIFENRDSKLVFGGEYSHSYFHLAGGNRYKPLPNFYFAKDPNFFSNFDRKNSHLPQPLQESYFAGIKIHPTQPAPMFGIYSAKSVSEEPGFYFVSPSKSYATTWAPYSRIGSVFINDTYKNVFASGWNANIQGEGLGRSENYIGFVYARGQSETNALNIDATAFRDNLFLSLPTSELVERSSVKQDLGFVRIRFKEYFAWEGLRSQEGLRFENGYGIHFPIWYGEFGGLVLRYRNYEEAGFYSGLAVGRGLFYEFRNGKIIISIGGEKRDKYTQGEAKLSIPLSETYFMELSCLYRDAGIPLRSWFENWSYATDFNMNLVDRKEIWKLKFVGPDVSLNVSISEKMESPTYIYYANFQFNYKF